MNEIRKTRLGLAVARQQTTHRSRESGQAMVEFALILLPLLLLVVGIIQFGIGLNYWLDVNRLSNQGARWAVVNEFPVAGCRRTDPPASCTASLQQYIACQPIVDPLKPTVTIAFPSGATADKRGDPVSVTVSTPFTFLPILELGTITLKAKTEMRIEQDRSRYTSGSYTPGTCP